MDSTALAREEVSRNRLEAQSALDFIHTTDGATNLRGNLLGRERTIKGEKEVHDLLSFGDFTRGSENDGEQLDVDAVATQPASGMIGSDAGVVTCWAVGEGVAFAVDVVPLFNGALEDDVEGDEDDVATDELPTDWAATTPFPTDVGSSEI